MHGFWKKAHFKIQTDRRFKFFADLNFTKPRRFKFFADLNSTKPRRFKFYEALIVIPNEFSIDIVVNLAVNMAGMSTVDPAFMKVNV